MIIGKGDKESFWNDVFVDYIPLKDSFPRIYALAVQKEGLIQNFGFWRDSTWVWTVELRRQLFGWEVAQWQCFKNFTDSIHIRKGFDDAIAWTLNNSGTFTAGSFRRAIENVIRWMSRSM